MDRMMRMLSPGTRRRFPANTHLPANKTFGVSLEDLVRRAPDGCKVPLIVTKICTYIEKNGLEQEGVFRVNGNSKTVEKLKYLFDHVGDAEFDDDDDIMAIAGLLKLFLREMSDAVIPQSKTKSFLSVFEDKTGDNDSLVINLKNLVDSLPSVNYDLLKFLIRFLIVVAHHETKNKMSPMALCIVFGPNLFKCGDGMAGMRDQGVTNQIVYKFITEYDNIFKVDGEDSPVSEWRNKYRKVPPVRPPPPKFQEKPVDSIPVPSPRKIRKNYNINHQLEDEELDKSDTSASVASCSHNSHSPHIGDDVDYLSRASPITYESDGLSIVESPVPTPKIHELVERTISMTVTEHIFGEQDTEPNGILSNEECAAHAQNDRSDEESAAVTREETEKHERQTPEITFEAAPKTQASGYLLEEDQEDDLDDKYRQSSEVDTAEFSEVERRSDVLFMFKKPSGPKRRSPSRSFRKSDSSDLDAEINKLLSETEPLVDEARPRQLNAPPRKPRKNVPMATADAENGNSSPAKSRIAFLDIHQENLQLCVSPESSPTNHRKPFVPPLDLTTLHQTVDGSDAIPALKAYTVPYHLSNKPAANEEDEENAVIISPGSKQLKQNNSWLSDGDSEAPQSPGLRMTFWNSVSANTDIPPSPPVDQDTYRKHSTDEDSQKLRQLTKKIQNLKRKIKSFEEHFERHHGYRPSQSDKAVKPEIKKYMAELSKARKDLKQLKEDAEMGTRSRHGSGASSSGETPKTIQEIKVTLETIYTTLREKRHEQTRPQEINMMNREQVYEEKLAVQKALLYFESLHGRPTSKEEKDLMRPLYDRYRSIKRILSKPTSPRNTLDLETVPEDKPFEMATGVTTTFKHGYPVRVPTAETEDDGVTPLAEMSDFTVTQDFSVLRDTVRPVIVDKSFGHGPKMKSMEEEDGPTEALDLNVQELTIEELHEELSKARFEKKKIRKVLRVFEMDFSMQNGRKVQKEDRVPMLSEYQEYKQIKAKIRLLEALLSKHQLSTEC